MAEVAALDLVGCDEISATPGAAEARARASAADVPRAAAAGEDGPGFPTLAKQCVRLETVSGMKLRPPLPRALSGAYGSRWSRSRAA